MCLCWIALLTASDWTGLTRLNQRREWSAIQTLMSRISVCTPIVLKPTDRHKFAHRIMTSVSLRTTIKFGRVLSCGIAVHFWLLHHITRKPQFIFRWNKRAITNHQIGTYEWWKAHQIYSSLSDSSVLPGQSFMGMGGKIFFFSTNYYPYSYSVLNDKL